MDVEGWVWPSNEWLGSDLSGKTFGLIGFGHIGRSMARMAGAGFNARVLSYSSHTSAEEMQVHDVEKRESLHDMLGECDFVSIHCVLNSDTRHLIDANALAAMKPEAILINTSRGAIVDERALVWTLQTHRIAGAGLDVFAQEPLSKSGHLLSPLFEMDNVILTPHLTFYTREAMHRLQSESSSAFPDNIVDAVAGFPTGACPWTCSEGRNDDQDGPWHHGFAFQLKTNSRH